MDSEKAILRDLTMCGMCMNSGGNNVKLIKKWGKKLFFGETKNITVCEIKFRRR